MKDKCKYCKKNPRREGSLFCCHDCKIDWLNEGEQETRRKGK
jgi:hypothetical protein